MRSLASLRATLHFILQYIAPCRDVSFPLALTPPHLPAPTPRCLPATMEADSEQATDCTAMAAADTGEVLERVRVPPTQSNVSKSAFCKFYFLESYPLNYFLSYIIIGFLMKLK